MAVAVAAAAVVLAAATGMAAVVLLLYRRLRRVLPACAGRFASVTPGNLAYEDTDLATPESGYVAMTSSGLVAHATPDYREVSFPSRGTGP